MGRNKKKSRKALVEGSDVDESGSDNENNANAPVEKSEPQPAKEAVPSSAPAASSATTSTPQAQAPATAQKNAEGDGDGDDVVITRLPAVEVQYCPVCTFPAEMCEYSGMFEKCKPWLMEQLVAEEAAALADAEEKGRKRRALTDAEKLDAAMSGKSGKKKLEQQVVLDCKARSGKKKLTTIQGLETFGINLQDISREFKRMFSCGAGVTETPSKVEVVEVQGDVLQQLLEILPTKYKVPVEAIYYMDGKNKIPASGP